MNYTMRLKNDNGETVEKISTVFTSPRAALALGIYRIKEGAHVNLYIQEIRPKKPSAMFIPHKKIEKLLAENDNCVVDVLNLLYSKAPRNA